MNQQRIAGYRIRRSREEAPPGPPITLYRAEVYNGSRKVHTTRAHITRERAIQDAADYVRRWFTEGTRLEPINGGRR